MSSSIAIGLIGGSGLYQMDGLTEKREFTLATPFGPTSDPIVTGNLHGVPVAFLSRHGKGHRLLPGEVPYRANIYALKTLGVRYLMSISAVGSLSEAIRPMDLVLPDQFIDLTRRGETTFFGQGAVAHVSLAEPVCSALCGVIAQAVIDKGLTDLRLHLSGTYVCIEGPAFSTRAESHWYRSMNASIIGMTSMPEVRLAREAEMAYAVLGLVTDYDCWHPREAHVSSEMALANLEKNAANAQLIVAAAARRLHASSPTSMAHTALSSALVTQPDQMSAETRKRLGVLIQRFTV
jgi:5'-methylthioadenosine phosphorylase